MKTVIESAITNIDDKYVDETIKFLNNKSLAGKGTHTMVKRAAVCVAASLVLVFGGVTAAVMAGNAGAYAILYSIYPDIANKLVPVNVSCVDNGIKMSVEAVNVEENNVDIYISLHDIEGEMFDESVDLFDSYSIHTNADKILGCSPVSYDSEDKTATFLISIMQDEIISGRYLSFSVSKILTGKSKLTIELPQIMQAEETDNVMKLGDVSLRGAGGVNYTEKKNDSFILKTNENQYYSPTKGVTVTAYGFVDGKLHIQTYYDDILKYDNHGSIYLKKGEDTIYPVCNYSFWDEDRKGSFDEYIFDISLDDLQNYSIIGNFVTCDTLIEGNWKVSFPIEKFLSNQ